MSIIERPPIYQEKARPRKNPGQAQGRKRFCRVGPSYPLVNRFVVYEYGCPAGIIDQVDGRYLAYAEGDCPLGTWATERRARHALSQENLRRIYAPAVKLPPLTGSGEATDVRLRRFWRLIIAARGKAPDDELRRQFIDRAHKAGLVAAVGVLDVECILEMALSGSDPWGTSDG